MTSPKIIFISIVFLHRTHIANVVDQLIFLLDPDIRNPVTGPVPGG
jgi:hypothetical protein